MLLELNNICVRKCLIFLYVEIIYNFSETQQTILEIVMCGN